MNHEVYLHIFLIICLLKIILDPLLFDFSYLITLIIKLLIFKFSLIFLAIIKQI